MSPTLTEVVENYGIGSQDVRREARAVVIAEMQRIFDSEWDRVVAASRQECYLSMERTKKCRAVGLRIVEGVLMPFTPKERDLDELHVMGDRSQVMEGPAAYILLAGGFIYVLI